MNVAQLIKARAKALNSIISSELMGDNPEPTDIQTIAKCDALMAIFNPRCEFEFDDDLPF